MTTIQPLQVTTTNNKVLVILDASAFKESSCLLRLFYNAVMGYKGAINANDIEFGTAFHKFRSIWRTLGHEKGFPAGLIAARDHYDNKPMVIKRDKKYLDTIFLQKACFEYAAKYEHDNFVPIVGQFEENGVVTERPLIEPYTRFAFPYYVDDYMEILMAGTMDELGKRNDFNTVCDVKTTGVRPDYRVSYLQSYRLSPQLKFYIWSIYKYSISHRDSLLAKIWSEGVGAFIDGVFYAGKDTPIEYIRGDTLFMSNAELMEFNDLIDEQTEELIEAVKTWIRFKIIPPRYGMLNGACQTVYGPCKYFNVCAAPDETTREIILEQNYKKEQYNPLLHGE